MPIEFQPIRGQDRKKINALVREYWGDEKIVVRKEIFLKKKLPCITAVDGDEILGFLHYQMRDDVCEIITLASLRKRQGIGSALVQAVENLASGTGCKILAVTTTNDNISSLVFYQRCGFCMAGLGLRLVDEARKLKPSIPEIGDHNIPIHDEIYLVKVLAKS